MTKKEGCYFIEVLNPNKQTDRLAKRQQTQTDNRQTDREIYIYRQLPGFTGSSFVVGLEADHLH